MVLKINRKEFEHVAGLYVYSTGKSPSKTIFKVGMSTNLFTRLRSYHTCYKDGYWIHNLVKIMDYPSVFSKLKPHQKKEISSVVRKVERRVHTILKGDNPKKKNYQVGQLSSRTSEWFKVENIETISEAIRRAYEEITGHRLKSGNTSKEKVAPRIFTDMDRIEFG